MNFKHSKPMTDEQRLEIVNALLRRGTQALSQIVGQRSYRVFRGLISGTATIQELSEEYGVGPTAIRGIFMSFVRGFGNTARAFFEGRKLLDFAGKLYRENQILRQRLGIPPDEEIVNNIDPVLDTPLRSFTSEHLSERALNALKFEGIVTLGDLISREVSEIEKIRNIHKKSVEGIKAFVEEIGYRFGYKGYVRLKSEFIIFEKYSNVEE